MRSKKTHIFVGIAAFNSEANIGRMLHSLCEQANSNFVLDAIVVHSDCSSDQTVAEARRIVSDVIEVVDAVERRGFAQAVQFLLQRSQSELTILLNDDIIINDSHFLEKLVRAHGNTQAGLICANPQPLPSTNFISRAIASSFYAYYKMALSVDNGNNIHTYDGKVMCLSKSFKDSLLFPEDLRLMGNVDSYIYYACKKNGYTYHFVEGAVVGYLCPTTMSDFLRWFIRNNANDPIMRKQFGPLVDKESVKPQRAYMYNLVLELLKNPLGGIFIFVMGFYIRFRAQDYAKNFDQTWEVVASTKQLSQV